MSEHFSGLQQMASGKKKASFMKAQGKKCHICGMTLSCPATPEGETQVKGVSS
jgi:hypothetical protein